MEPTQQTQVFARGKEAILGALPGTFSPSLVSVHYE